MERLITAALALAGAGLLAVAYFGYWPSAGGRSASADGVVVRVERTGAGKNLMFEPIVGFSVDGVAAESSGSSVGSATAFAVGDKVEVRYDPAAPQNARIVSWRCVVSPVVVFCIVMGLTMLIVPLRILAPRSTGPRRPADGSRLKPAQAQIVEVHEEYSFKDGIAVWRLHLDWRNPADGQVHRLRSTQLTSDPRPHLTLPAPIPILIDPQKPSRYEVDVSAFESADAFAIKSDLRARRSPVVRPNALPANPAPPRTRPSMALEFRIGLSILWLLALILAFYTVRELRQTASVIDDGQRLLAVVTKDATGCLLDGRLLDLDEHRELRPPRYACRRYARLAMTLPDGRPHEAWLEHTRFERYSPGVRLAVVYSPAHEYDVRVDEWRDLWGRPFMAALLCAVFVGLGFMLRSQATLD